MIYTLNITLSLVPGAALPPLPPSALPRDQVRLTLRVLNRTAKALRVAAPWVGPANLPGARAAWVPRSQAAEGRPVAFGCVEVEFPVWLFRRVREELAGSS